MKNDIEVIKKEGKEIKQSNKEKQISMKRNYWINTNDVNLRNKILFSSGSINRKARKHILSPNQRKRSIRCYPGS